MVLALRCPTEAPLKLRTMFQTSIYLSWQLYYFVKPVSGDGQLFPTGISSYSIHLIWFTQHSHYH
ncbi:hypothetical protein B0H13DRAFT_2663370 [Mycena leptocephala]|nr:hypothetical protein B0H13DRAFT_2663370 [Mycena leptocephala]